MSEEIVHWPMCSLPLNKSLLTPGHDPILDNVELILLHNGRFVDADDVPSYRPHYGEVHGLEENLVYALLDGIRDLYRLGRFNQENATSFYYAQQRLKMKNLDFERYIYNPYRAVPVDDREPVLTFTLAAEFCGGTEYYRELFGQDAWENEWMPWATRRGKAQVETIWFG